MKKVSKWYWIASALLLLWAAKDLYAYLTMGRELLVEYPDVYSVREMVKGDLIRALVKAGLALLLPPVGFWRSRRKPLKAVTAVTGLLALAVMGTWFLSMVCLTLVTAQEIYDGMYDQAGDFAELVDQHTMIGRFYDPSDGSYGYQTKYPDYLENRMFNAIAARSAATYSTGGSYSAYDHSTGEERHKLIRDIQYPLETAVLFYDGNGRLLHSSEDDVLYFDYYTREEWDAGQDDTAPWHYGWIDISEGKEEGSPSDPYLRFRNLYAGTHSLYDISAIRVTGYFEGTKLVPVVMHYVTDSQIRQVVEQDSRFQTGPGSYAWKGSDVDRTGDLEWQLQFDRSAEYEGKALVTVYLNYPEMWDYQEAPYVYKNGVEYKSLDALAKKLDFPSWANIGYHSGELGAEGSYALNDLLVFGGRTYADYGSAPAGTEPAPELFLVTAVHGKSLSCAVSALRNVYLITALLALILLWTARQVMGKKLLRPVGEITKAMEEDWKSPVHAENVPSLWQETAKLSTGFEAERDRRRMKDNEVTRLNTALEYARTAEENRRQMTSNIAHELKTPLAVIHSYAEGLREQIAPEKREKYLDVILSESERTDAMVLEMLDLSRLEAGKVKLSRDEFSLSDLTRVIFDKLQMVAEAKKLQISCEFSEQCTVVADENRIAQVVENFATNAVKYTPEGGRIAVRIRSDGGKTTFSVENDSEPLSDEALEKAWDTFYRTDEARSGGGTGLGLAIAKNIIELHGGKCSVQNTKTGVEFRFSI